MTTAVQEPTRELVDPRVAARGGTRSSPKANYDFPGMMDASSWRRTEVHRHTSYYGCNRCGQQFAGPHAVYTHLAKVHGIPKVRGHTSAMGAAAG